MSNTHSGTEKKRKRSSSPPVVPLESIPLEPRPSKSMPREATLNKSTVYECASSESILPQRIPSEPCPDKPIPLEQSPEPTPASPWVPTHIHTIGPHTPRIELDHPATKMTLTHDDKYLAVVVGERELCLYDTSNFELVSKMIVLEPSHKYNELRFAPLLMENSGYMLVTRTGKIDIYDFNPRVKVSIGSVHVPLNDAESQGSSAGSGSDGCEESHGGKGVRSTLAKYTTMCVPERRITLSGYCIKFSKDGSFMTYTMYGKQPMVVIWDVKEQQLRKAVNLEVKKFDVTICPNSRLIATASNSSGLIRVWKAADGHCVSVFGVAEDKVDNVIFSPNSTRLAVQYRKGERLHQIYDIPTGQTIFSLSNSYHPRA